MRMLQSLLLATDFQPASNNAACVAARLASAFGTRVSAIHVVEPWLPAAASIFRHQQAERMFEDLRTRFSQQQVPLANCSVRAAPVADAIVRNATEVDADLIVLGAGELSASQAFTVGPIAQSVMEQAPQPVLTVHPAARDIVFRTILCPVDHSAVSRRGLRNAVQLARVLGSRLVVLSVVPDVSWLTAAVNTGELADAKLEYEHKWCEELETFLAGIHFDSIPYVKEVRSGAPHDQIIAAAKEHQADLIVMGATGRTGLVRVLLGSTARRVLRDLPCSLLTVKQEDVIEEFLADDLNTIALLMAEGYALYQAGSYEPAAAKFRQALARNPFNLQAVERLAEAYHKLGQNEQEATYRRRAQLLRGGS